MALLPFSRVDRTPTKPNATRSTVLVAVACVAMANSASASSGIDKDAPVLVETTVDVAAPPEVVWEVLTEPARWASWNELIASAWIEGSVAEGSLIEWATAPEAGGFTIRSEIILAERNRVLEWRGIGGDMVALHSWRLEPIAGGRGSITTNPFVVVKRRVCLRPFVRSSRGFSKAGTRRWAERSSAVSATVKSMMIFGERTGPLLITFVALLLVGVGSAMSKQRGHAVGGSGAAYVSERPLPGSGANPPQRPRRVESGWTASRCPPPQH